MSRKFLLALIFLVVVSGPACLEKGGSQTLFPGQALFAPSAPPLGPSAPSIGSSEKSSSDREEPPSSPESPLSDAETPPLDVSSPIPPEPIDFGTMGGDVGGTVDGSFGGSFGESFGGPVEGAGDGVGGVSEYRSVIGRLGGFGESDNLTARGVNPLSPGGITTDIIYDNPPIAMPSDTMCGAKGVDPCPVEVEIKEDTLCVGHQADPRRQTSAVVRIPLVLSTVEVLVLRKINVLQIGTYGRGEDLAGKFTLPTKIEEGESVISFVLGPFDQTGIYEVRVLRPSDHTSFAHGDFRVLECLANPPASGSENIQERPPVPTYTVDRPEPRTVEPPSHDSHDSNDSQGGTRFYRINPPAKKKIWFIPGLH